MAGRWEEEGRGGGGEEEREDGGRGLRMNHGAFPWGGLHFVTAQSLVQVLFLKPTLGLGGAPGGGSSVVVLVWGSSLERSWSRLYLRRCQWRFRGPSARFSPGRAICTRRRGRRVLGRGIRRNGIGTAAQTVGRPKWRGAACTAGEARPVGVLTGGGVSHRVQILLWLWHDANC